MKALDIHIGELIETILAERNMSKAEFARRINTSRQNITSLFKRSDIDVKQLFTISKVLDYDFMQHFRLKKEKLPETEISIQLKIKTDHPEDLFKWISENSNLQISAEKTIK